MKTEDQLVTRRRFFATTGKCTIGLAIADLGLSRRVSTAAAPSAPYPPAKAVTSGPKHHFFGYYDKCPWDKPGRYLLAMENDFCDRQPNPGEALALGMVDLKDNNRFIALDTTLAWCWQQGTMLQWVGSAPDREVIYNSVEGDHYISIIRDVHSGKTRKLPLPIYAISRDATQAVVPDFARLHRCRPGYGYAALPDKYADEKTPEKAGIWWMDLRAGRNKLIIPFKWAANNKTDERFLPECNHWFNHLAFNPSGTRFLFLHRWAVPGKPWSTRLYTAKPDGSDIRLICDTGMVSHFDWRDDNTILAWARSKEKQNNFYLFDAITGETTVVAEGVLTSDGHCSYSPDGKWILCDTYPDKTRMQTLILYRIADGRRIDIGKFYLPPKLTGPYRCDL
ncbi:hypothetical protein FJY63_08580, partial [Candidatus Sumerlaeota bacterium]|nr:hypothetical protein [Candidatus Sumerlaeota bacterium]